MRKLFQPRPVQPERGFFLEPQAGLVAQNEDGNIHSFHAPMMAKERRNESANLFARGAFG
jgi:hypothetical protein